MEIEEGIYAKVSGTAGITNLIGTSPVRFYPESAPQEPKTPYLVYEHDGSDHKSGATMNDNSSLIESTWTFTAIGTKTEVMNVIKQVKTAFKNVHNATWGDDVAIVAVVIDNETAEYSRDSSRHTARHGKDLEVTIWHRE